MELIGVRSPAIDDVQSDMSLLPRRLQAPALAFRLTASRLILVRPRILISALVQAQARIRKFSSSLDRSIRWLNLSPRIEEGKYCTNLPPEYRPQGAPRPQVQSEIRRIRS